MMIDFDDLDSLPTATPKGTGVDLKNVHIATGGERTTMVDCPKCNGTGMTRWGRCFRCEKSGTRGKISMRSAAASKARVTREQNSAEAREAFFRDCAAEWAYIGRRAEKGSNFYAGMQDDVATYGSLSERKLEMVRTDMAKDAVKREEFKAANTKPVDISGIVALFDGAIENQVKKPVFRADGITLSKAAASGRNPGAIYVKSSDGEYLGKIAEGKFQASFAAPKDTHARLCEIAADPSAEAIRYARKTSSCSCCGRTLVNPVSILAVVGPICAEKWNLGHLRDAAADEYAEMQEAEKGAGA
jgi:hypothetical protein